MRTTAIRYWGILLTGGILGGCLYYGPQGTAFKKVVDYPRLEEVTYFDYTRAEMWPPPEEPWDWGLYQVQRLRLPTSLKIDLKQTEYTLYYYRPKGQGPFPSVIILPITRGDYYTQNFAIYLAERGYACLRFESTKNFTDD